MNGELQNQSDALEFQPLSQSDLFLDRIVLVSKALSDPIRIRMLNLMAMGRHLCGLKPIQALAIPGNEEPEGICVCEFQEWYNLGQSKVSYHLRILREAGLVQEEGRGKWTFYSLNKKTAKDLLALIQNQFKL